MYEELMADLKSASGDVDTDQRLVTFLYLLLRDHLPAGTVLQLVGESQVQPCDFTNGHLANYAKWLAEQLA